MLNRLKDIIKALLIAIIGGIILEFIKLDEPKLTYDINSNYDSQQTTTIITIMNEGDFDLTNLILKFNIKNILSYSIDPEEYLNFTYYDNDSSIFRVTISDHALKSNFKMVITINSKKDIVYSVVNRFPSILEAQLSPITIIGKEKSNIFDQLIEELDIIILLFSIVLTYYLIKYIFYLNNKSKKVVLNNETSS